MVPDSATKTGDGGTSNSGADCADELFEEVCRNPSLFGRLIAISNLWDGASRVYKHSLSAKYGPDEVARTLERLHSEVFLAWLSLNLRQQMADVLIYIEGLQKKGDASVDLREIAKSAVPTSSLKPERDLFQRDIRIVEAVLPYELPNHVTWNRTAH